MNLQKMFPNSPCWCGSGKKYKYCHMEQDEKVRMRKDAGDEVPSRKLLKTAADIEKIKESAKINMACLDAVAQQIHVGMSTQEIDDIVHDTTVKMGGIPAPLNYEGFPKSVCTSLNDEVCHGIPSESILLQEGDIINVDCSTILDGYYSDSSRMFCVGKVSEEDQRLVRVVRECVQKGLEQVKPWGYLGDVGAAVNAYARENGYSVVREIGGHGIGKEFHEDPWVSFVTEPHTGMLLVPGLTFTIEPMVNAGVPDVFEDADNGWTIYTDDGRKSAQWEIMVTVTQTGHEVLCW